MRKRTTQKWLLGGEPRFSGVETRYEPRQRPTKLGPPFKDGLGFDGSSIRGWQGIHVSDMLAVPDADTAVIDPFFAKPTVSVIANIVDPVTRQNYSRDPRYVARKGAEYLKKTGIADTCYIGPERICARCLIVSCWQ